VYQNVENSQGGEQQSARRGVGNEKKVVKGTFDGDVGRGTIMDGWDEASSAHTSRRLRPQPAKAVERALGE
jgi:hypothetical protein